MAPIYADIRETIRKLERGELSIPQMLSLKDQILPLLKAGKKPLPDNPADFAMFMTEDEHPDHKWEVAPHLRLISDYLTELIAGKRQRLMIFTPPRHGKSELVSKWLPVWFLAKNPTKKIILASYEQDFSNIYGRAVRDIIQNNQDKLSITLDSGSTAAHRWSLTSGGGMMCAGAGGPITGKGADLLIVDDPVKNDEEASSEVYREKLFSWWQSTAFTRLSPTGVVVIIMTRWNEDDVSGRLENLSTSGEGLHWDILRLPALAEDDDPLGRKYGEALWPTRFSREWLLDKKRGISPYLFSALYQQHPTPEEGNAVRRSWWGRYQVAPDVESMDVVIQSWDLAFKDMSKNDFTVGQVWGRKGASLYLLDQIRGHLNAEECVLAIRATTAKWPRALAKLIEDKANGPAVIQMLSKKVAGVIPINPKASKDARLAAVIPFIAAGNVHLPEGEIAPWVGDFIEECAAFPKGANDDCVDAMTQALNYLNPQASLHIEKMHREALNTPDKATPIDLHTASVHKSLREAVKKTTKKINTTKGQAFRQRAHTGHW